MGATVRQRKDRRGTWTVYYRRGKKRWAEAFGGAPEDETVAREVAAAFNREEEARGVEQREQRAARRAGSAAAFVAIAEGWWEAKEPALPASSRIAKRPVVYERLIPHFGALDVRRLDEDAASKCAVHFAELGHARETVETTGSILDSILAWAVRRQLVERCPLLRVCGGLGARAVFRAVAAARCPPPARVEAWTVAELQILLECARERGTWLADPILFLAQTGCRRGELIALEWEDVDLARGRARIRQTHSAGQIKATKADKVRTVDLAPETVQMLERRAARVARSGRVFRSPGGKPWEDYELSGYWLRMRCSAAERGVRRLKMHCLRHSYASLALAAGHDVAWIAGQIGDTLDVFLTRYAHVLPQPHRSLEFVRLTPTAGDSPSPAPSAPGARAPELLLQPRS